MCTLLPPLSPPIWPFYYEFLELQARLTPFWKARRLTDEIIDRDRKLVREYHQRSRVSVGLPDDRQIRFLCIVRNKDFYYIWFRLPHEVFPDIVTCFPLRVVSPDFVVQKCKLRRDQIEYLERGRLEAKA